MITDEQRREVANGLRHQVKKLGSRMDAHEFAYYVADVIDPDNELLRWDQMTLLLADFIDRPTCKMTREGEGFRCSACGTFHDMSGFEKFPWPHCPNCGAEVVDDA